MIQAQRDNGVIVHYKGSLKDGTVFDSSFQREPLQFVIGQGMVIPGFENGIIGMTEGETRTISIPVGEAYGDRNEDLVFAVDRSRMAPGMDLRVGMTLQLRPPDGSTANARVKELSDDKVTLDLNHPLAGEDLVFELKLVKIVAESE
jgi:peptidylprolyl isomerase